MKLKPANLQNVAEARDRMQSGEVFYHNGFSFYQVNGRFRKRAEGHALTQPIYRDDCANVREWKVEDKFKLKPCPFCGSERLRVASTVSYWVVCDSCDVEGPIAKTEQEAVDKWNRRTKENDNI